MRRALLIFAVIFTILIFATVQTKAQKPVVYGLFFYSPTCPHCHDVLTNHWPAIQEEFGDQLIVLFINVTVPEGSAIMQSARQAMGIESTGVPMLIIGDTVLIGSIDIPEYTARIVREGLANGGIGYPPIPDIEQLFYAALGEDTPSETESLPEPEPPQQTLSERLQSDPTGSGAAIVVLVGLVVSAVLVGAASMQAMSTNSAPLVKSINMRIGRWVLIFAALAGCLLALSLLQDSREWGVTLLAGGMAAAFLILLALTIRQKTLDQIPHWAVVVVMLAGLAAAGYLAYVEASASEAVCGAVGDCNAVQQSSYARIAGIPVGVIGIIGYALLLVTWLAGRVGKVQNADRIMLLLVSGGVLFSIYLTFLEPFVIGAVCAWCLTSAVVMLILLWLAAAIVWFENQAPAQSL